MPTRIIATLLLLAVIVAACNTATPLPPTATPEPTPKPSPIPVPRIFRIVAYVTEGVVDAIIPYDQLTHINYAFLTPNADGTLNPILNSWKLKNIVVNAHARNVKVLISVGGWGWDAQFETVAADPALRSLFIQNLKTFVDNYQLDGVDMDWEYPDAGQSAQNFLTLMQELRAAMPDKELTTAVVAYGNSGMGILPETFAIFDFVNIMTYDGPDHGSMEQFNQGLAFWSDRGLPSDKIVLGVPFYGDPDLPYRKFVADDPAAAQLDSYEYLGTTYHYNGMPTVRAKTQIALEKAGGIMFWTLDFDALGEFSLVNVIYQTVHGDK